MIFTVDPTTDVVTAAGNTLKDGTPVRVSSSVKLPAPLDPARVYFLRDRAGATFKLALFDGDAALDFADAGEGVHDIRATRMSALDSLYTDVERFFRDKGLSEYLGWGRRELTKQINQKPGTRAGRVIWIPGDDTGKTGELGAPKFGKRIPRTVLSWRELATVHIWGRDATAPNDERAHYRVARDLFEQVCRAIDGSSSGMVKYSNPTWNVDTPVERVFGCELTFEVTVDGRVCDAAPAVVNPTIPSFTSAMVFPDGEVPVP
ncbi:MAG: hypothetical protein HOW73_05635 [Polyangiaceae bacterium]|nr:hypothetical protein [Polyangiaceae bacterium]